MLLAGMEVPPNYGARYAADFRRVYVEVARKRGAALMPSSAPLLTAKYSLSPCHSEPRTLPEK